MAAVATLYLFPTLLLYTDGVTEARNEAGELFAEERLVTAVQSGTEQTAAGRQTAVLQAIAQFSGQAPQSAPSNC